MELVKTNLRSLWSNYLVRYKYIASNERQNDESEGVKRVVAMHQPRKASFISVPSKSDCSKKNSYNIPIDHMAI